MFIDYLLKHGVLNNNNYNSFKHYLDIELLGILIKSKTIDSNKMSYYWGEYIRGNGNNKRL